MPAPRPRARAFMVRGKPIVSMYHPKEYTAWQAAAAQALIEELADVELPVTEGPVTVGLIITVPRPKTTKLPHPKPDVDNYAKPVLDAMTKAGVFRDDSQVAFLAVLKKWGDEPSIGIEIRTFEPGDVPA